MSFLLRQESHHQLQNPLCCCKIHTFITHYLSLSHQQLSLLKGVPLTLRQGGGIYFEKQHRPPPSIVAKSAFLQHTLSTPLPWERG